MNDRFGIYADEAAFYSPTIVENEELAQYLIDNGFFAAPASANHHGNYEGGLFDHSLNVFKRLNTLTKQCGLKWQRQDSPFIVGMFHDLCKIDQYKLVQEPARCIPDPLGGDDPVDLPGKTHYEYNNDLLLTGHGEKSVMLLSQFVTLTEEEMLCIRYHMGAYQTDDWPQLDLAIGKCPNILYAHMADMLATKIDEV